MLQHRISRPGNVWEELVVKWLGWCRYRRVKVMRSTSEEARVERIEVEVGVAVLLLEGTDADRHQETPVYLSCMRLEVAAAGRSRRVRAHQ